MATTSPFPYTLDPDIRGLNETAVFKLIFGKKYFIFKGLKMAHTVENLSAQIHRELRSPKDNSILFKVVAYVKQHRVTFMGVEVIAVFDDIVEILDAEYQALQAARKDPNCLNIKFTNTDYYPAWVPQKAVNEFMKVIAGERTPDKHKALKRFLRSKIDGDEAIEEIFKYVTTRFK